MATLTIRNIGDATARKLKSRARKNKRSLEAEVRVILDEAANPASSRDFWKAAERVRAMTPPRRRRDDSTKIIRQYRDQR